MTEGELEGFQTLETLDQLSGQTSVTDQKENLHCNSQPAQLLLFVLILSDIDVIIKSKL